jgi:hypothetical protein
LLPAPPHIVSAWAARPKRRRYADDVVVGFQHKADAERFRAELAERLATFALTLHPDKTRSD